MKKILLVLAVLASVQIAGAQQLKNLPKAQSDVASAQKAADDAKKSTKYATWMNLGKALVAAYTAPTGNGIIGDNRTNLQLTMAGVKPVSSETVNLLGATFTKDSYETADYYFNEADFLVAIVVTKPAVENALGRAADAYKKAFELDTKGQKTKDITLALQDIASKYYDEAYNYYTIGNRARASEMFEASARVKAGQPLNEIDTVGLYSAGVCAYEMGNSERAKILLEEALSYGYSGQEGGTYPILAGIAQAAGDNDKRLALLEEGFTKYPKNQTILVGLIQYYSEKGDDNTKLFELINSAKANEPNNPTLPNAEGDIKKGLGDFDGALAAYREAQAIDPNYVYSYTGEGILFYERALKCQEDADKLEMSEWRKYDELIAQREQYLKECIAPFEKAFEVATDDGVKSGVAQYLKSVCFRFSEEPEFKAKYDKYNEYLK